MKNRYVITIDGPAGVGKSTVARMLARSLEYIYLDTGALYRALALKALDEGVSLKDEAALAGLASRSRFEIVNEEGGLSVLSDGKDVSRLIRTEEISVAASNISRYSLVRQALLSLQRRLGQDGGIVAEGRDTGTVVFPDADYKFYLDAESGERVRRRHRELILRNENIEYKDLAKGILQRDKQDRERDTAPLKPAADAIIIDTTRLSVEECLKTMLAAIDRQEIFSRTDVRRHLPPGHSENS